MFELDCRGLSCPLPVIRLQKAIAAHPNETILLIVDTGTSRDNTTRVAEERGYTVKETRRGDEIDLELTPKK
jgi:tRNA 2-thiouridine synthesizing protein A